MGLGKRSKIERWVVEAVGDPILCDGLYNQLRLVPIHYQCGRALINVISVYVITGMAAGFFGSSMLIGLL